MAETCPRCGFADVTGERCPRCRVVVATYRASLEALRRGPTARAGAVRPPEPAAVQAPPPPGGDPSAPTVARPVAATQPAIRQLTFHGSAVALLGIQIVNALLTLLTLGVFYFWAKARVRRYLFGETELEGDRFAYHGTGRELLLGFLRGAAVVFIPVALLTLLPELYGAPAEVKAALSKLLWLLGLLVVPVAMVGARRYRLSRMSWRGIRFSFRGRVRDFVQIFVVGTVLTSVTLGLYYPIFVTQRQAFMVSHAWFGSSKFDFDGRGRHLFKPFLVMILLFLPTLGLSWFWFSARRQRYFTEHTRFGSARFRSTVTGGALARLQITNFVALILSLGLAWPWTRVRALRFTFRNTMLAGLDLASVRQDARAAGATGEALSGLLDADFGVS